MVLMDFLVVFLLIDHLLYACHICHISVYICRMDSVFGRFGGPIGSVKAFADALLVFVEKLEPRMGHFPLFFKGHILITYNIDYYSHLTSLAN